MFPLNSNPTIAEELVTSSLNFSPFSSRLSRGEGFTEKLWRKERKQLFTFKLKGENTENPEV